MVIVSTAFTVIDSVAVMLLFATDVAVIVAVVVTEMLVGAVYTTVVLVLSLNEPGPERRPRHATMFVVIGDRGSDGHGFPRIQRLPGGGR